MCHFCIVVRSDEVISRRECCLPSSASMRVRKADIAVLRDSDASAKAHEFVQTHGFAFSLSANRFRRLRRGRDAALAESTHEDGPTSAPPAPPELDPTSSSRPATLLPNDSIASIILS